MKIPAIALLTVTAALALGGQVSAATHRAPAAKTLTVVMHDPGCHWFSLHGKLATTASVRGPIRLRNLDEATLKVASRAELRLLPVGKSIRLARGHYVVMMVGQAVDDNYLKLTVR